MKKRKRKNREITKGNAPSPTSGKRACLCDDGTYSRNCCDGSLQAQGIGSV